MQTALDERRRQVSRHFELVFSDPEAGIHPLAGLWLGQCGSEDCGHRLGGPGFARTPEKVDKTHPFPRPPRYGHAAGDHRTGVPAAPYGFAGRESDVLPPMR